MGRTDHSGNQSVAEASSLPAGFLFLAFVKLQIRISPCLFKPRSATAPSLSRRARSNRARRVRLCVFQARTFRPHQAFVSLRLTKTFDGSNEAQLTSATTCRGRHTGLIPGTASAYVVTSYICMRTLTPDRRADSGTPLVQAIRRRRYLLSTCWIIWVRLSGSYQFLGTSDTREERV